MPLGVASTSDGDFRQKENMLAFIREILQLIGTLASPTGAAGSSDAVGDRPVSWDVLYEHEKELARTNYEKEEERYRFLTEKAKVTFLAAALIGSIGLSKLDVLFPRFSQPNTVTRCILVAGVIISLGVAVLLALLALWARKCKAVPRCGDFVDKLYDKDADIINRSLADLYQSIADDNANTNEKLARQVNWAMLCTTISFVLTMLLIGDYAHSTWSSRHGVEQGTQKEVRAVVSDRNKGSDGNEQKQLKPPQPIKVEPRTLTGGADKEIRTKKGSGK